MLGIMVMFFGGQYFLYDVEVVGYGIVCLFSLDGNYLFFLIL
jgi:hypothetical protein